MTAGPTRALFVCEKAFDDQIPVLMKALRARHGTRFILAVASEGRREQVRDWCVDEDEVVIFAEIEAQAEERRLVGEALHKEARRLERLHDLVMMRDVVMQDRTYAGTMLGYADYDAHTGADRESVDQILGKVLYYFQFWAALIDDKNVDFVFGQTGGISETAMIHEAMLRKIPVSIIVHSRFGTLYSWASDSYLGNSLIREEWERTPEDVELLPIPERPLAEISEKNMAAVERWRSTKYLVKNFLVATYNRVVWRSRDIRRRRWSKRLPYLAVLRKHLATWLMFRRLDRLVERDVDVIVERPFVLFLLSLEPEYTTLTLAKEFNNTEALIRQLAQSLPAGMTLVVKEHVTNVGNRSASFYKRLLALGNVVLADYRLFGVALAARAEAVASVSGTIGIEAGMLGKDVIGISDRTEYAFLPNQHTVHNLYDLPDYVERAIRPKDEAEVLKTRLSVARYKQAVERLSYDVPDGFEMGGDGMLSEAEAERAVDVLEQVIAHQKTRYAKGEHFHRRLMENRPSPER